MHITLLGTGASAGVPVIGCDCNVCTSPNPKNKRTRASLLIASAGGVILVDSAPDLRTQALTHGIRHIDAVIYTHAHADHTHGIDELRSFNYLSGRALPIYADQPTLQSLQQRFSYAFVSDMQEVHQWVRPSLCPHILKSQDQIVIAGSNVSIFTQTHGNISSLGVRVGHMAYSTDVNALSEDAFQALKGVKIWIVDCLREQPSPTHSHLSQTLEWIKRVKPELAVLTHMSHELDYEALMTQLPSGVVAGYDGMVIKT